MGGERLEALVRAELTPQPSVDELLERLARAGEAERGAVAGLAGSGEEEDVEERVRVEQLQERVRLDVDDAVASALAAVRDSRSSQVARAAELKAMLEEAPAPAPPQRELGELEA